MLMKCFKHLIHNTHMKITKTCIFDGSQHTVCLPITFDQYDEFFNWPKRDRRLIQDIFPNLTIDQREFLISGTFEESLKSCGNCQSCKEPKTISIKDEMPKLLRFDLDPVDNGEFIELEKRFEEEGKYVLYSDVLSMFKELKTMSNIKSNWDKFFDKLEKQSNQ